MSENIGQCLQHLTPFLASFYIDEFIILIFLLVTLISVWLLLSHDGPRIGLATGLLPFLVGIACWFMRLVLLDNRLLMSLFKCTENGTEIDDRSRSALDYWIIRYSTDLFKSLCSPTAYLSVIFSILDFDQLGDALRAIKLSAIYRFFVFRFFWVALISVMTIICVYSTVDSISLWIILLGVGFILSFSIINNEFILSTFELVKHRCNLVFRLRCLTQAFNLTLLLLVVSVLSLLGLHDTGPPHADVQSSSLKFWKTRHSDAWPGLQARRSRNELPMDLHSMLLLRIPIDVFLGVVGAIGFRALKRLRFTNTINLLLLFGIVGLLYYAELIRQELWLVCIRAAAFAFELRSAHWMSGEFLVSILQCLSLVLTTLHVASVFFFGFLSANTLTDVGHVFQGWHHSYLWLSVVAAVVYRLILFGLYIWNGGQEETCKPKRIPIVFFMHANSPSLHLWALPFIASLFLLQANFSNLPPPIDLLLQFSIFHTSVAIVCDTTLNLLLAVFFWKRVVTCVKWATETLQSRAEQLHWERLRTRWHSNLCDILNLINSGPLALLDGLLRIDIVRRRFRYPVTGYIMPRWSRRASYYWKSFQEVLSRLFTIKPSLEMRRLRSRQLRDSIPAAQSSTHIPSVDRYSSSCTLHTDRYFNPNLHEETRVISTGFGRFPVSVSPRPNPKVRDGGHVPVPFRTSSRMDLKSSASNEQTPQTRPFITDDDFLVGGIKFRAPGPGLVTEDYLRTELDYLNSDTNEVLQQATDSSELQDLCLSKWRMMKQTMLWAEYCEAKREMRSLLYPTGNPEEDESEEKLYSPSVSRVRSINSHRFADFLSRTAIAAILREKKWGFSSGDGSEGSSESINRSTSSNVNEANLSFSPHSTRSNGQQVDNVDLEKQNNERVRQTRAELLFDMSSQLLLRKDLPYAEPQVLSCLHSTIDDACRRRKNDKLPDFQAVAEGLAKASCRFSLALRRFFSVFYGPVEKLTRNNLIQVRGGGPGAEDVSERLFVPSVSLFTEHKRYKWCMFLIASFELFLYICVWIALFRHCPSFPKCDYHVFFWAINLSQIVFIIVFALELIQRVNYVIKFGWVAVYAPLPLFALLIDVLFVAEEIGTWTLIYDSSWNLFNLTLVFLPYIHTARLVAKFLETGKDLVLQEASPIAISRTIDYGKLLKLQYWQVVFALTCSAVQSNEKKMAQLTEEFQNLDSVPLRELKDIKHLANKQIEAYQSDRPDLVAGADTLALCRKMCNFLITGQIEQQRSLCALSDAHYFNMMQRADRLRRSLDLLPPALPPPSLLQFENEWGPNAELINSFLTACIVNNVFEMKRLVDSELIADSVSHPLMSPMLVLKGTLIARVKGVNIRLIAGDWLGASLLLTYEMRESLKRNLHGMRGWLECGSYRVFTTQQTIGCALHDADNVPMPRTEQENQNETLVISLPLPQSAIIAQRYARAVEEIFVRSRLR